MAVRLLAALILGCAAGAALGPGAGFLGDVGLLVIKLLKTLATPLVFFAVVDSFCRTRIPARRGLKLVGLSLLNACVALAIALSLSHLIPIARFVDVSQLSGAAAASPPKLDFSSWVSGLVPQSVVEPFETNNVITVVIMAVLLGAALRKIKDSGHLSEEVRLIERLAEGGLKVLSVILGWVVKIVPIAVFAVIAKFVGASGLRVFYALGAFVGLVALGIGLHAFAYYSLLLSISTRKSPLRFFSLGSEALLTAFSTGSSLATLPVTLETLQEKMKVRPESARLAACVGTNLNHDGILLYEAVAALFIAQLHGISLDFAQQVRLSVMSVLAAVGIAGVPEAGLITLSMVVGAVGLPLASVPLLLPVDWLLGRLRATANVASDMVVANLLDVSP